MQDIELREYATRTGVDLTVEEVRALRSTMPSITIAGTGVEGVYDLTATSIVGAVSIGDRQVVVLPKVGFARVLYLVTRRYDPAMWRDQVVGLASDEGVFDVVADLLCREIAACTRGGLARGYRQHEEALMTVRGQVRFDQQIRSHYGRMLPVECAFDEFTEDIEVNRVLRAALDRVAQLPLRSASVRSRVRGARAAFIDVASVRYHPGRVPEVRFDRLTDHLRPAVALADLVLRSTSPEHRSGRSRVSSFSIDMNRVFEDFVVSTLREELHLDARSFPQNARGRRLALDRAGAIGLEPDLSWWSGNRCRFVGDVKYKRIEVKGVKNPDLYQLLAYCIATDLPAGLLVYAAGEATDVDHEIDPVGRRLLVRTLPIDGSIEEIQRSVAVLAAEIRSLASLPTSGALA